MPHLFSLDWFTAGAASHLPVRAICDDMLSARGVTLAIKRLDKVHPQVSGNKFFKLKYNLLTAQQQNHTQVLTFGGAHSNHIAATACAAQKLGLGCVLVVRGDELKARFEHDRTRLFQQNTTLKFVHEQGARLHFVSRADYRRKDEADFITALQSEFGDCYVIPEGGTNPLAVKGCAEMLTPQEVADFDVVATAVGTGGTLAGLSCALAGSLAEVLGVAVVGGSDLKVKINQLTAERNWQLNTDYTFGGYAKVNSELIEFVNAFYSAHHIPLEPVYTGKLLYALYDIVGSGHFPKGTRILALHTGGLQGVAAMQHRLAKQGLPALSAGV